VAITTAAAWSSPAVGVASATTVSFPNGCCADMQIAGDAKANHLQLTATEDRIVLHDSAPGASITSPAPFRCSGKGTSTLSCARDFLVAPITVYLIVGPRDSFDTGSAGCAGGAGFALAGGSREAPGRGEATIWGGPFPDQFASYGRARTNGCGGADQLNATLGVSHGGPGADFISARSSGGSSARLLGGPGHDQLIAAGGGEASGGAGNDELYDTTGRSTLRGDGGNDQVGDRFCVHEDRTGDGRDRMFGGPGRDILAAGCISRPVHGDPNAQRLVPTEPDFLDGGGGRDRAQAGRRSTLRRIERVTRLPRTIR